MNERVDGADGAANAAILAAGWQHASNQRPENATAGLGNTLSQSMPRKVLARVKKYFRRDCRKPSDMKLRTYWQHVLRINNTELEALPPFAEANKFSNDDPLDILLFAAPRSWQNEMDRQNFDAHDPDVTLAQVVSFMENIEAAEENDE